MRADSYLAGSDSRAVAYLCDLALSGLIFAIVVSLGKGADLDVENGPVFAVVLFLYHAYFLASMHGMSLGKNIRSIYVVNARGGTLLPKQAIVRAALVALPYAGFVVHQSKGLGADRLAEISTVLSSLWLLAEVSFLMWSPQRRTIADRLAGTIVVKVPPVQPHRAPAGPMYSATDAEFGPRSGLRPEAPRGPYA